MSDGADFSWNNLPDTAEITSGLTQIAQQMAADEASADPDLGDPPDGGQVTDGAPEAQDAAPAAKTPVKPAAPLDPMAALQTMTQQMQQQNLLAQQAMQQQMQQFMAEMVKTLRPEQPAKVEQELDPMADLDENDPDYTFKMLEARNIKLERELRKVQDRFSRQDQEAQTAQQTAAQQQQHQQFVQNVTKDLQASVDYVFRGWPETEHVQSLKELAAARIDAQWASGGYTAESLGAAIRDTQKHMQRFEAFKTAKAPTPSGRPTQVGRGGNPASDVAQKPITSTNEFWRNLENDKTYAEQLRSALRGDN